MDAHRTFRAMGTTVTVLTGDERSVPEATAIVRRRFEREEARFSRFRSDSELSCVNRTAGQQVPVSAPFAEVLHLALDGASRTAGRFDPTVHDALMAAGYDRDLDEVLAAARVVARPPRPCGRWSEVQVADRILQMPADVHLDLGGIAKGWTVDRAAEDAIEAVDWVLVNAGGDLRVAGAAPVLDVDVEDPLDPRRALLRLQLRTGALATSSVTRRSWGPSQHHLIDPRTGAPTRGELLQATVWAPTCAEAEVAATAAIVAGTPEGDLTGVFVGAHTVSVTAPREAA